MGFWTRVTKRHRVVRSASKRTNSRTLSSSAVFLSSFSVLSPPPHSPTLPLFCRCCCCFFVYSVPFTNERIPKNLSDWSLFIHRRNSPGTRSSRRKFQSSCQLPLHPTPRISNHGIHWLNLLVIVRWIFRSNCFDWFHHNFTFHWKVPTIQSASQSW